MNKYFDTGEVVIAGDSFSVENGTEEKDTHGFEVRNEHDFAMLAFNRDGNDVWHNGVIGVDPEVEIKVRGIGDKRPRIYKRTSHKYYQRTVGAVQGSATLRLNTREQMPKHLMCNWIIRVK